MGEPPFFVSPRQARKKLRELILRQAPRLPGVYGLIDGAGELAYVGKAKSLRARLLSYFQPGSSSKQGRIARGTRRIAWEVCENELEALLREVVLIRRHRPAWNVQLQPKRQRRVFLCLGRGPAPHVFVAARPPKTALRAFGPLLGQRKAREAAARLNDLFRLKDCPQKQAMHYAGQAEMFPLDLLPGCLRQEIGSCMAPCAASCTAEEYQSGVDATLAFLSGEGPDLLAPIQATMMEAAARLEYERAAVLRARLSTLTWASRQLARIREAQRLSGVYTLAGRRGGPHLYVLRQGVVTSRLPFSAMEQARSLVNAPEGHHASLHPELVDSVLIVGQWFRKHPEEMSRLLWRP
jgi:excinuclease ABC subunit C